MTLQTKRRSKRHELSPSKQIDVKVERLDHDGRTTRETIKAKIVDISLNGFKLSCHMAFEFQEKLVILLPRRDGKDSILVTAEVRWVQPMGKSWSAGCLIAESFPDDYIDEISQDGILDRRTSDRHLTDQNAVGRWELSQQDAPIAIRNVSANGLGIFVREESEVGKRIRIKLKGSDSSITAKAVWQRKVDKGYQIGCEVLEGSPYSVIESAITESSSAAVTPLKRYQSLTFCGISFLLVILIRNLFFS